MGWHVHFGTILSPNYTIIFNVLLIIKGPSQILFDPVPQLKQFQKKKTSLNILIYLFLNNCLHIMNLKILILFIFL